MVYVHVGWLVVGEVEIAVVGCGFWGRQHVRVLSSMENVVVKAVSDIDLDRARLVADEYGIQEVYGDSLRLLRDPSIDAVTICTPTTTHWKIAEEVVGSGRHVLVEKPICDTVEQARLLIAGAEEAGVILMPGHIERFNPGLQRVKGLLDKGLLGEVVLLSARRVGRWPDRVGDVGVVKDSAIHDLDLARYLLSEEPVSIYARAGSLVHRFEDFAEIVVSFPGVKTVFIESNWLTPRKIRRLTITGMEALVNLDFLSQEVILEKADRVTKIDGGWIEPLRLELEHFVDCVVRGLNPDVSGADGLRALELAESALKSSSLGKVVLL